MNRKELLDKLSRAKIATSSSARMAGEDCFVFRDKKLFTTNQRCAVVQPFDADVSGAIDASNTAKLIKSLKGDEVTITLTDKGIQFKDDSRVKLVMSLVDESISNWIMAINPDEVEHKAMNNIADPLRLAMLTKGDRELNGVFIQGCNMFATDGYRVTRVSFDGQFDPLWINDKCCQDIINFGNTKSYFVQNSWLHLFGEQGQFSCRRRDESAYPAAFVNGIDALIKDGKEISDVGVICFLHENINLAKNISENGKVWVSFGKEEIQVSCVSPQGSYHNSYEGDFGIEGNFLIHSQFVLDLLRKEGVVSFGVVNTTKKIFYAKGSFNDCEWLSLVSVD